MHGKLERIFDELPYYFYTYKESMLINLIGILIGLMFYYLVTKGI